MMLQVDPKFEYLLSFNKITESASNFHLYTPSEQSDDYRCIAIIRYKEQTIQLTRYMHTPYGLDNHYEAWQIDNANFYRVIMELYTSIFA